MVCGVPVAPMADFFVIDKGAMEELVQSPFVFTSSDGRAVWTRKNYTDPRETGSFVRKLRTYAIDRGMLSLQDAILSMSSRPAEKYGLSGRGRIATGYFADLSVIDLARLRDLSTYSKPTLYAEGVVHVLVNGVLEVENGALTGARGGRACRRG